MTGRKVGDETIHTALLDIAWTGDEGPLNVTSSFSPPLTDAPAMSVRMSLSATGSSSSKVKNHLHRFALMKYAVKKHLGLMGVNMFRPASEVEKARTANGGWTKAKLAEFGVPWPPPKGWKRELEKRLARGEQGSPERFPIPL